MQEMFTWQPNFPQNIELFILEDMILAFVKFERNSNTSVITEDDFIPVICRLVGLCLYMVITQSK